MNPRLIVLLASINMLPKLIQQIDGDMMDDADVFVGVGFRRYYLLVLLDALNDLVEVCALHCY